LTGFDRFVSCLHSKDGCVPAVSNDVQRFRMLGRMVRSLKSDTATAERGSSSPFHRRIGVHLSTAGGVARAIARAAEIGADTLQIFSSSPRMWRASAVPASLGREVRSARERHGVGPLAIHASYLINVCSQSAEVVEKSAAALRGEVERALALGAEFLILHPGSYRGMTRREGLTLAAETIAAAVSGLSWPSDGFQILIENTAGAEHSLGGSLEQVQELIGALQPYAPVAACLDTCHLHAAGYDILSERGWQSTFEEIASTVGSAKVRVWHCNDAKSARGSRLDRHEHIGRGSIGLEPFRRLLAEPAFAHAAFIAETPVDEVCDEAGNVRALRSLLR
jgi:deoxyribonuclease-4